MKSWIRAAFGAAFLLAAAAPAIAVNIGPAGPPLPLFPSIPYTQAQPQDYVQLFSPRFTYPLSMTLTDLAKWSGGGGQYGPYGYPCNPTNATALLLTCALVTFDVDNFASPQAAISAAVAAGGGVVRFSAKTYTLSASLILYSNVYLLGSGVGATKITLANNVNADVLQVNNTYSNWTGGACNGESNWGVFNLTIDGNGSNQIASDTVNGLASWGYHFYLDRVYVQNVAGHGIRSGWCSGSNLAMEAHIDDVGVDNTGRHGVWFAGPHDSILSNVIIVDAGQSADNTYDGAFIDVNGNSNWIDPHIWHRSTVTNRVHWAFASANGSTHLVNPQFEGGRQELYLSGNGNRVEGGSVFANYSSSPMMVISGSASVVKGTTASMNTAAAAVQIGETGTPLSNSSVEMLLSDSNAAGPVSVVSDAGGKYTFTLANSGSTLYSGSWSAGSDVDMMQGSPFYNFHQHPGTIAFGTVSFSGTVTAPGIPGSGTAVGALCVASGGGIFYKPGTNCY